MSVSSREMAIWRLKRGDAEFGPYTSSTIRAWAQQGSLAQDVLLTDGTRLMTLEEFLVLPPDLPPVPPPPPTGGSDGTAPPQENPEEAPQATPAPAPPAAPVAPADELPVHDRIVILGRTQSGKTVYLATLYDMLWRRTGGLCAKALTGRVHSELANVVHDLKNGRWPKSTMGSNQMEFEIEHNGKKRLMVTLDFQGEIFAKAFVRDQQHDETVKPLLETIDRAAAALLLVDPAVVAGQDHEAAVEDDFGLVQVVERIYNWPDGRDVPIVFVLTKSDEHQHLLDQHGGPVGFVRHFFPALVRTMKKIPIFQVSAVQCSLDADGNKIPKPDSVRINIDKPLLYCLDQIDHAERLEEQQRRNEEMQMELQRLERERERREKAQIRMLIAAVALICLVGAVVVGLIIYYRF